MVPLAQGPGQSRWEGWLRLRLSETIQSHLCPWAYPALMEQ